MNKNTYFNLALIAAFVFAVIAFGYIIFSKFFLPSTPGLGQKMTLEYWGLFESEIVMKELIKRYEAENQNVKINYVQRLAENDVENYKSTLYSRLRSGTGPSIFRAHSTWMPEFYSEISKTNKSLTYDQFVSRFYDIADIQCVTVSYEIVCIPIMYDGLVLLYNVDILRNEGIVPQSIRSWEDLRVASIRLTRYEESPYTYERVITRGGVALGSASNVVGTSDIIGLMFAQNGIEVPDDLDSEKAGLVFEFYDDFVTQDKVWAEYLPNSLDAFATGQVAMVFATSDQILEILKLNPTINLGALPVPQLPLLNGSLTDNGWASFWVESVSADLTKQEQEEAWKFLEWLSREENQIARFNYASSYKKFGEPYSAKALRNNLINSPLLGPLVLTAPNASTGMIAENSGNTEFSNLINTAIMNYGNQKSNAGKAGVMEQLKLDYEALSKE